MNFNERLKKLREERGIYQKDVAKAIGTSVVSISYYEKGTKSPGRETLIKLADYFGVTTDFLLYGNESSLTDIEKEFPEGISILRRATKELTKEQREQLARFMKTFISEYEK